MWVLSDSIRLRILLAHSRWTLNVWLHFVTWQDQEVLHIVWHRHRSFKRHRHRSLHRTSTQICAFADTDLCTCVIFSCQSNAHDSLPATSRVPEMVSTPEEFCYNTFNVISVQKKGKKFCSYVCFCFCLCVMFVPHECSLYLYAVCDCVSIFGQYSDSDLSNASHSAPSPGWILMMFAHHRQTVSSLHQIATNKRKQDIETDISTAIDVCHSWLYLQWHWRGGIEA